MESRTPNSIESLLQELAHELVPREALLERGASLGRYLVLERLGAGGMGVVYSAFDPRLDRKVALKLLRDPQGGEAARARLLREAQAIARLSHPNVVAIHDVGTVNKQVFVAMELVEGSTLRKLLNGHRRGAREVLRLFLQAGRGLAAAHAAKLVHRDFKPDNVLVGKDDRVRVADFGLARLAGEDAPSPEAAVGPAIPTGSAALGTPAYMAPEQARGQADARSDQYAFCLSLCEMLCGELPSPGSGLQARAAAALKKARAPSWMSAPILRGLRDQPDARHASMEALLAELERDPGAARRRLALGALGALAVFGVALALAREERSPPCAGFERRLAGVWDGPRKSSLHAAVLATRAPFAEDDFRGVERTLDGWASAWVAMSASACEATRVRGEQSEELFDLRMQCLGSRLQGLAALSAVLEKVKPEKLVGAAQSLPSIEACADLTSLRAVVPLPANPAVRARIAALQLELARIHAESAGPQGPAPYLARLRELLELAKATGYGPLEAEAAVRLGGALGSANLNVEAEKVLRDAVIAAEASHSDRIAGQAWELLIGSVATGQGRYGDEILELARHVEAYYQRGTLDDRIYGHLQDALGDAAYQRGDYPEALARFRRALEIRERQKVEQPIFYGWDLSNIGAVLVKQGRTDEALAVQRRGLEWMIAAVGPSHPAVASLYDNLGDALDLKQDFAEALLDHRRAVEIFERHRGPRHPDVARARCGLAHSLALQGKLDEALGEYRNALSIEEEKLGPRHPFLAEPLAGIGAVLLKQGKSALAVPALSRALALLESQKSPPEDLGEVRFGLARALPRGERARAQALAVRAGDDFRGLGGAHAAERAAVEAWLSDRR